MMYSCYNGVPVVDNPAYSFNKKEPRYMIMMPKIELYCDDLRAAKNYTKNKKRIAGQRRRGARKAGF